MAGVRFAVTTEVTTGTATLTLMQLIAAANKRVRINRIIISGKGILSTDAPVTCEVLTQTSAGTTGASATVGKVNDSDDESLGVTAAITFSSTEPTAGAVKASRNVHPQSGVEMVFPPGINDLFVAGGGRMGIRVNSPAQATTLRITVEGEE